MRTAPIGVSYAVQLRDVPAGDLEFLRRSSLSDFFYLLPQATEVGGED